MALLAEYRLAQTEFQRFNDRTAADHARIRTGRIELADHVAVDAHRQRSTAARRRRHLQITGRQTRAAARRQRRLDATFRAVGRVRCATRAVSCSAARCRYRAHFERVGASAGWRERLFAFGRLAGGHVRGKVARDDRNGRVGAVRSRFDGGDLLLLLLQQFLGGHAGRRRHGDGGRGEAGDLSVRVRQM